MVLCNWNRLDTYPSIASSTSTTCIQTLNKRRRLGCVIPASCLTKRCAEQHLKTHRNLIHLLVEFRVWHDPPAEGLQLREAGVVGRLLEVRLIIWVFLVRYRDSSGVKVELTCPDSSTGLVRRIELKKSNYSVCCLRDVFLIYKDIS